MCIRKTVIVLILYLYYMLLAAEERECWDVEWVIIMIVVLYYTILIVLTYSKFVGDKFIRKWS